MEYLQFTENLSWLSITVVSSIEFNSFVLNLCKSGKWENSEIHLNTSEYPIAYEMN